MNDATILTGTLPPLTGTIEPGSTERTRDLLIVAKSDDKHGPAIAQRTARIDSYVTHKVSRLGDLRRAVGLTQQQVASELGVSQPEVSKFEGRNTWLVDTLNRFVAATGGRLRIIAEYDDAVVELVD